MKYTSHKIRVAARRGTTVLRHTTRTPPAAEVLRPPALATIAIRDGDYARGGGDSGRLLRETGADTSWRSELHTGDSESAATARLGRPTIPDSDTSAALSGEHTLRIAHVRPPSFV